MYDISEIKMVKRDSDVNRLIKENWVLLEICSTRKGIEFVLGRVKHRHCDSRGVSEDGPSMEKPSTKN